MTVSKEEVKNISLKDSFNYAEKIKVEILDSKIEDTISYGKKFKETLKKEGITGKEYTKFMRKVNDLFKKYGKKGIRERTKRYK